MELTNSQLTMLIEQARREAPNEACGLIGGKDGCASRVYPLDNVDPAPRVRYLADAPQLLRAMRDIEETRGDQVLAIYHSHPASPAFPSPTDVERAFYPDAVYIVVSLMNREMTQVRGFRIRDAAVVEETLEIVEEEDHGQARTRSRRHSS